MQTIPVGRLIKQANAAASHLVPQVVVLVSVPQRRRPVLLPLLHVPVEHVDAARRGQPPAGRTAGGGGRDPAAEGRGGGGGAGGGARGRGAGRPQDSPPRRAAHRPV